MESRHFDDFTRALGGGLSRRRALKGLAAGVAGGLAALVGRRVPDAVAQDAIEPTCDVDADCAEQGLVNHICDVGCGGRCITCVCPSGYAPCSNTLCCPPTETGSLCPPEGGTTCVGQEPVCSDATESCETTDECCDGLTCIDSVCVTACAGEGELCVQTDAVGAECCDGFACNAEFVCEAIAEPAGCETDDECAEGAICCAGVCREIECCIDDVLTGGNPNDRCADGAVCFEGICVFACKGDSDCAEGTCCCGDGTCHSDCCGGGETPVDTGGETGGVTTLPSTGIGDGGSGSGLLGAAAVAGAAAYLAGKKLKAEDGA